MRNEVMNGNNGAQTISSREVAEMMGIRHGDLLEKIDGLNEILADGGFRLPKYWVESTYTDTQNKQRREYQVTKKGCEFIAHKTIGKNGVIFTAKYMERFEEMENTIKNGTNVIEALMNPDNLLTLVTNYHNEYHKRLELEAKTQEQEEVIDEQQEVIKIQQEVIETMQPKVEFADDIITSKTTIKVGELAKLISNSGVKATQQSLFKWLRENGLVMKQGQYNVPTQKALNLGILVANERTVGTHKDGSQVIGITTLVTGKGQQYISKRFIADHRN